MSDHLVTALSLERSDGQYEDLIVSGTRAVDTVEGLVGTSVREIVRPRPSRHGVINSSRFRDSQPIVVTGELYGSDADDAWVEYNAVAAACASALDTDRYLRWSGGTVLEMELTKTVRLVSLSPPIKVSQDVFRYQLILRPNDPRAFAQSAIQVDTTTLSDVAGGLEFPMEFEITFTPSGGGSASFTVEGNDKTPPTIEIHGLITSPRIQLESTGEEIILTGEVDADRYLVIDVANREIRTDDDLLRNNLYDYANSTWFDLPPGPQTINLFGATFDADAYAVITYRPAYA